MLKIILAQAPIRTDNMKVAKSPRHLQSGSGRHALPSASSFSSSKKDKRLIKHSTFISKVEKPVPKPQRRRSSSKKKLLSNLDALADALPDAEEEDLRKKKNHESASSHSNVISQKTLPHKPGSQKRRERLEKLERDRFLKNMAQMTEAREPVTSTPNPPTNADQEQNPTSNRWAALRGFISQTMEQRSDFQTNR